MKASAIFGLAGLALLVAGCDSLTQTGVQGETPTGSRGARQVFGVLCRLPRLPHAGLSPRHARHVAHARGFRSRLRDSRPRRLPRAESDARHGDGPRQLERGADRGCVHDRQASGRTGACSRDAMARLRQSHAGRRDGDRDLSEEPPAGGQQGARPLRTHRHADRIRHARDPAAGRRSAARSTGAVSSESIESEIALALATGARRSAAARAQG